LSKAFITKPKTVHMPTLSEKTSSQLIAAPKPMHQEAIKFCGQGEICHFRYEVKAERSLVMEFSINRSLVEKGFFPYYVPDVAQSNQQLGWGLTLPDQSQRVGLFFATSGLSAGAH